MDGAGLKLGLKLITTSTVKRLAKTRMKNGANSGVNHRRKIGARNGLEI